MKGAYDAADGFEKRILKKIAGGEQRKGVYCMPDVRKMLLEQVQLVSATNDVRFPLKDVGGMDSCGRGEPLGVYIRAECTLQSGRW